MATIMNNTKPYRLEPVSMGDVADSYNLTKALELADSLEDEELTRVFDIDGQQDEACS